MGSQTKSYFGGAIIGFLIWTYIYYNYLKPKPTIENNVDKYWKTGIYFCVLVIIQISISWTVVSFNCNMLKDNGKIFGELFISTFCPWFFIFGLAVMINSLKPQFKYVFSNTFGYFFVNNDADNLFKQLLKISDTPISPTLSIEATTLINKIVDNTGIIINTITPENFSNIIHKLQNTMNITTESTDPNVTELFKLVVKKDNIGEFFWYLYNALFVIAIVTYNISLISCK